MKIAAILMGGYSGEWEISIKSGDFIFNHIDKNAYKIIKVFVLKDHWLAEWNGEKTPIDKNDFSFLVNEKKMKIDVVYNTIHGNPGENGLLQAYFDLIDLPYTGCGHYESALTFNKVDCNLKVANYGHTVAKSVVVLKNQKEKINYKNLVEELGSPFMVKASRSGSSIGVSKVKQEEYFLKALENSFEVDNQILVEEFVSGTEISIGVFREISNEIRVLEPTEIIPSNDFFDFDAKYSGKTKEVTPANISNSVTELVKQKCKLIYNQLELSGIVRIDFIIKNEEPYFIEVNTNPGMSPNSIFPQQARYANLDLVDLFTNQLNEALEKKNNQYGRTNCNISRLF